MGDRSKYLALLSEQYPTMRSLRREIRRETRKVGIPMTPAGSHHRTQNAQN